MIPNIGMYRDSVSVETYAAISGFNAVPSYLPATVHRAQIVDKTQNLRTGDGDQRVSSKTVMVLSPDKVISGKDKITFPDGTTPIIVRSRAIRNGRGQVVVYRLLLGNSRRTG